MSTSFWLLFCTFSIVASGESCSLLAKDNHGGIKIHGHGLHRQLEITTFIQAKSRVPQCQLLYKVVVPERAYVDERELQSSLPGYNVTVVFRKSSNTQMVYLVRQKLYLSTFEMKESLTMNFCLQPPSNFYPKTLEFKLPYVALDCKGEFRDCTVLKGRGNQHPVSTFGKWLHVKSITGKTVWMEYFRGEQLHADYSEYSGFILFAAISYSIVHLVK